MCLYLPYVHHLTTKKEEVYYYFFLLDLLLISSLFFFSASNFRSIQAIMNAFSSGDKAIKFDGNM
jgi:hypothetical protein